MIVEKEKLPSIEYGGMEYALEGAMEISTIGVRTKVENYYINFQIPFGEAIKLLMQDDDVVRFLFPQKEVVRTDGLELSLQYVRRMEKLAQALDNKMESYSASRESNQPFFEMVPLGTFRFEEDQTVQCAPIEIFILTQFFGKMANGLTEAVQTRGDKIFPVSPHDVFPIYLYKEDVLETKKGFDFYLLVADAKTVKDLGEEK